MAARPTRILADPQAKDQPLLHPPHYADFTHARLGTATIVAWSWKSPYPMMVHEVMIRRIQRNVPGTDHSLIIERGQKPAKSWPVEYASMEIDGGRFYREADFVELWQDGKLLQRSIQN